MTTPLVSIGMPVYNGGEQLRRTLEKLLAQTEKNFELVISDNASTDGITQQITEEFARRDSRIRLIRQPVNKGPLFNYVCVLEAAQAPLFMWAAHDDAWSPNFVEEMVKRLDAAPDAVMATPCTHVERTLKTGVTEVRVVPESPAADRWTILDAFLTDFTCVWFYGMYRTEWMKQAAKDLYRYPILGSDRIWLLDVFLKQTVVGAPNAVFYYSCVDGKPKDRSSRTRMRDLGTEIYHMTRMALQLPESGDRAKALRRVWWYLYRYRISRRNPVGTMVRIAKLSVLGAWFGLEAGARQLIQPRRVAG